MNLIETTSVPNGLNITHLGCNDLLEAAKNDVEQLLTTFLKGQIASNQHCYINLPHPLTVENFRESAIPVFNWGDKEIENIEKLFFEALSSLGFSLTQIQDMKQRANVIVREYKLGQYIPFHVDELECSPEVCGIILLNDDPQNRGLCFQKGEGKNKKLNYTIKENVGSAFFFEGEARYSWKHGLLPVKGRRISITCRFYKKDVINNWKKDMENAIKKYNVVSIELNEPQNNDNQRNVRISICDSKNMKKCKPIVISNCISYTELKTMFKNKLGIKVKTIMFHNGDEFKDGMTISQDSILVGKV